MRELQFYRFHFSDGGRQVTGEFPYEGEGRDKGIRERFVVAEQGDRKVERSFAVTCVPQEGQGVAIGSGFDGQRGAGFEFLNLFCALGVGVLVCAFFGIKGKAGLREAASFFGIEVRVDPVPFYRGVAGVAKCHLHFVFGLCVRAAKPA